MKYKALSMVVFFAAASAFADGGYFPRIEVSQETVEAFREDAQRAFLYYDADTGDQRLVLDVQTAAFSGDFVWLVPIPHVPADGADFLDTAVAEVPSEGFADLAALADPEISLVVHEVRESFGATGGFFACAPMAGGGSDSQRAEQDLAPEEDTWAQRSTDSYVVSLYTGTDFDQFVSHIAADIGAGTADAVEAGRDALEGYFSADLVEDDTIAGPFSMVILEGSRREEAASSPAIRLDFPTDAPFFALTVSQVGFEGHMEVEVFTAGPLPVLPADGSIPFRAEIDFLDGTFGFGEEFAGGYNYWFYDPPDYSAASGFVSRSDLEGAEFDARVEELIDEVRAAMGLQGLAQEHRSPQWTTGLPYLDGLGVASPSVVLTKYSRLYGSAADMEDIVFATPDPAETDVEELQRSFTGQVRIHAAVRADLEETQTGNADLSFLLALAFPAGIVVKRRLSRASFHNRGRKAVHTRRRGVRSVDP